MAGALVGGAVLSASLQVLLDRLASRSIIDFISRRKHSQGLMVKKLKTSLISAEAVLNDAAVKHVTSPPLREWLAELEDAAKDGRDLLEKMSAKTSQGRLSRRASGNKLGMILERLEYMVSRKDVLKSRERLLHDSPTTSFIRESRIHGRADEVEALISLLLAGAATNDWTRTVSVVGVAGIGKTTLAQHVYNDLRVKNSFDLHIWVCLSSEPDAWTVTKMIFEAVTRTASDIKDLNEIQLRLKEEISGKKLLLVLDDVRSINFLEWETLRSPLRFCDGGGSVILVTSRSESTAGRLCTIPPYHLSLLSYEDSWSVFSEHAFERRYCNTHPQLEAIGKEIVRKCSGLPGTAKALGIFLHSKADPEEWEKVLKYDLRHWVQDETEILMTLTRTSRGIRGKEERRVQRSLVQVDSVEHCDHSANQQMKMSCAYLIIWIILLSILSGLIYSLIDNAHVMERKKLLGSLCDERAQMVQDQFIFSVNHIHVLGILLTRFYYSKNSSDTQQMQEFFSNYMTSTAVLHPHLNKVVYAERVVNAERKKFEKDHGWEIKNVQGEPAKAHNEYAPVIFYTEPVGHMVSLDIMSGEEDREAIFKARNTGSLTISPPFRLLRSNGFSFVLIFPVFKSELPPNTTMDQRKRATAGYIGGLFNFARFTDSALSHLDGNQTILFSVYDVTNVSKLLLMYGGDQYDGSNGSMRHESELKLGDPTRKHKMICKYGRKTPICGIAIIIASSFFVVGLLLGCISWGAAFHIVTARTFTQRFNELDTQAEATNTGNPQVPAIDSGEKTS
ncbi:hypothetical protein SAY87_025584 [Trapa incisa]|uniref:CHASE domain-containing protein n=1 Tax=Trapa incisa TaxID=236973 RepID=A0AAN7J9J3_9MYRT|nr:hypothetical protein SAY87_025584 [Trapa incisa]